MHRQVLGLRNGDPEQGDHIDGDRLNNRRLNLRRCTQTQNSQNMGPRGGTSRYKGVSFEGGYARPWSVRLRGKIVGRYSSEAEAAGAYDAAAVQAYGEFARTNFSGVDGARGVALRSASS